MSEPSGTEPSTHPTNRDLQGFVLEENLKLYRRLLAETDDAARRRVLDRLLAETAAALRRHIGRNSPDVASGLPQHLRAAPDA